MARELARARALVQAVDLDLALAEGLDRLAGSGTAEEGLD